MSDMSYDQKLQTIMGALEQGQAAIIAQNDEIERQSKLIDEFVEVARHYVTVANALGEQGEADKVNLLISKAQSHKPNEGQRDE